MFVKLLKNDLIRSKVVNDLRELRIPKGFPMAWKCRGFPSGLQILVVHPSLPSASEFDSGAGNQQMFYFAVN